MDDNTPPTLLDLTAQVVANYVGNNSVPLADLTTLIQMVHEGLSALDKPSSNEPPEQCPPAVPIKKSITPDYLISLETGERFQMLKRHLTKLGLNPDQYRRKWGLPADYPMVAPNYSWRRSEVAKRIGLGTVAARNRGGRGHTQ